MAERTSKEELLAAQRKEKKEIMAKTQKMKHSVPKGDKKKKKEMTVEIAQMLADLDSKHEKELQELERTEHSSEKSESPEEKLEDTKTNLKVVDTENVTDSKKGVTREENSGKREVIEKVKVIKEDVNVVTSALPSPSDPEPLILRTKKDTLISKDESVTEGECVIREESVTEGECVIREESVIEEVSKEKDISKETISRIENVAKRKIDNSPSDSPADSPIKDDDVGERIKIKVPAPRLSKAQKRRNKKSMLAKEREKAIAEQEIENLQGLRHIESVEIIKKLSQRNLTIYEIPSDGNCLYKAVEHQLSVLKLKETTVQMLREKTSEYMLMHMQDYIPFLTSPDTGDILTEKQYVEYCEDVAKTPSWGGQIEIQVLYHILGYPIEVIQAQGPSIIAGDEKSSPKLILSFHRHAYGLGEHYNSVIPICSKN